MSKIDYCYHSHTKRCGHASGEDEDYIKTALEIGLKEYGFSDHAILPGIIHPNMRGEYSLLDDYVKSIRNLQEKYKNQINIHLGFEAEYMDEYHDYYKELLDKHVIDYLILGQHCYYENNHARWYLAMKKEKGLKRYTDHVIKGIESGLFTYVAHPDLFCLFYDTWDDFAKQCSMRIIDAAIKHNMPLEINLCKVRAVKYGYIERQFNTVYPYDKFWELVSKTNAHVVVGIDTHKPEHNLIADFEFIDELIKKTGIRVDFNYRFYKK